MRTVPGVQQVLALAYQGSNLQLLAGSSQSGFACCGAAEALQLTPTGRFRSVHRLVNVLAGATLGALVPTPPALLAAVATGRGVWVAQAARGGAFGRTAQIAAPGTSPQGLAATSFGSGRTFVAWPVSLPSATYAIPSGAQIYFATGTARRAPAGARLAVSVPPGYSIDEIAAANGGRSPTVAFVESWYEATGAYRSRLFVTDAGTGAAPAPLSSPGGLAGSVSLAGDGAGDEVAAWRECDQTGACVAEAALRTARGGWGRARRLGALDPTQAPVAAQAGPSTGSGKRNGGARRGGQAVVGWVDGGRVYASAAGAGARRFGRDRLVSSAAAGTAADLTLAFAPGGGQALAAWTQGSPAGSVMAAPFTP